MGFARELSRAITIDNRFYSWVYPRPHTKGRDETIAISERDGSIARRHAAFADFRRDVPLLRRVASGSGGFTPMTRLIERPQACGTHSGHGMPNLQWQPFVKLTDHGRSL
jgi:hypothetical protein